MSDKKISQLTGVSTPLVGTEELAGVQSGTTKKLTANDITSFADNRKLVLGTGTDFELYFDGTKTILQSQSASGLYIYTDDFRVHSQDGVYRSIQGDTDGSALLYYAGVSKLSTVSGGVSVSGDVIIATAGKGIDFSANTHAAGMTSELLDDYEEGTWTVTLFDAASGGNASTTTTTGYYTKIGNVVHCTFGGLENIDTTGMTAGNVLYISLPFTAAQASAGAIILEGFAFQAGNTTAQSRVSASASRATIGEFGTNSGTNLALVSQITSGADDLDRFALTYFV